MPKIFRFTLSWLSISVLVLAGIAPLGCGWQPMLSDSGPPGAVTAGLSNPLFVPVADRDFVWNQLEDELDNYFRIRRQERVRLVDNILTEGWIETFPKMGSTLLEPWRTDSTPGFEKLHSSLQTIRRWAHVRVTPTGGGYQIEVAVYKELEDLEQPEQATVGGVTLRHDSSPQREPSPDPLQPGTHGWIPLGRDTALEQRILSSLLGRLTEAASQTTAFQ